MASITNSQFHILENEIRDNINLKAKLNAILEEVREVVSFEIHSTCRAMTKASESDAEFYNDYETLDCEAWTPDYIDLITLNALRDIVNKTILEEVANNITEHTARELESYEDYEREMQKEYEREMQKEYEREMQKDYDGYKSELRKEYDREMRGY